MLNYARDDTHYLLYIYDKMRLELWERGNEQPTQLQVEWQRSRDICLKVKPDTRVPLRSHLFFALLFAFMKRAQCLEEPRAQY